MSHLLSAVRLPYPPYAWRIARTGALVWLVLRLAIALIGLLLDDPSLLLPGFGSAFLIVVVAALLVRLDLHRSGQHLFHANLGVSPRWSVAVALAVATVLENLVQIISRALIEPSASPVLG